MESDRAGGHIFALPPSLGPTPVRVLADRFREMLGNIGFLQVVPVKTYAQLERGLLDGSYDAAWGPPIVCARVESGGGLVALRAVRYGATTYRSVLLCRAKAEIDIKQLGKIPGRELRAAWVDRWSMGGYILPRYHLRSRGLELSQVFSEEQIRDSYGAAFQAVLDGEADMTASYANRRGLGYVDLCGKRAVELRALAYTDECPNDGVVLSSRLPTPQAEELVTRLRRLTNDPDAREVLATGFDVNGFDVPPVGTYSALLALL